jgi:uncharacterized protein YacL
LATSKKTGDLLSVIILSGLIVGWLDILAAFLQTWLSARIGPVFVLDFIASGLFGRAAFNTGKQMAVYGLIIHFLLAYAFTLFFFAIYPRLKILAKSWPLTGIVYGILIWLVMNLVVLRISQIPQGHFKPLQVAIGMGILIVVIGLPLSYVAKRYYRR